MIPLESIFFVILAAVVLISALMVVTLRNILHCAIFLVFTFLGVSGIYILLNAEFLFAAQIMVYVGAISVLILFGVMLTHEITSRKLQIHNRQVIPSLVAVLILFGCIITPILIQTWGKATAKVPMVQNTTEKLGDLFLGTYLLPFELASFLLLMAMVGAIVLAMMSDRPQPVTNSSNILEESKKANEKELSTVEGAAK